MTAQAMCLIATRGSLACESARLESTALGVLIDDVAGTLPKGGGALQGA